MGNRAPHDPAYSTELFHLFVEKIEDHAIFAMDCDGCVVHWNEGAERITGYAHDEILSKPYDLLFTAEDRAAGVPKQELDTAISMGRATDERWHMRKDGSLFWALGIVAPIRTPDGSLRGFGKILRDRTDLKELQETLQRRNEALQSVDERKNHFLATLAHELRNPLGVLANAANLLRHYAAGEDRLRRIAEMVDRQILHTKRLVEDLSDVARVGRGKLQLHKQLIDLRALAAEASDTMRATFEEHQQGFTLHVPDTEIKIDADPDRIQQVLLNLLTNASRYTPRGGRIALTAELSAGEAVVRVEDNGIGIPPDRLQSIFELFTQAHAERAESQAGLGIGLALTQQLVALHGGTVQARSDGHGKGSEFIVRLPATDRSQRGPMPKHE